MFELGRQIADECYFTCFNKLCKISKKIVIALEPSAALGPLSALRVLGRRFESYRPDSNNQCHIKVSQPVFFIVFILR